MDYRLNYEYWLACQNLSGEEKAYLKEIEKDEAMIEELFYQDLPFGTGGMRGIIGIGTNRINVYMVKKATQALAEQIIKKNEQHKGVAIAYDSRNYSKEFAEAATQLLLASDIRVYLFDEIRPTPELSFAVRELNCAAGIVITASHNPKEYNGYKLYNHYGGQMVPDEMKPIIEAFGSIDCFSGADTDKIDFKKHDLFEYIGETLDEKYKTEIKKLSLSDDVDKEIKIIYTPIHGTGYKLIPEVLKEQGFQNIKLVPEQAEPDGEFPTVKKPNPEEKEALDMALALAKVEDAELIMATDPDADRIGLAIKSGGEYILLDGNQTGALFLNYIIENQKKWPKNPVMVKTIVTSTIGEAMAKKHKIKAISTLTGFKYIGEAMENFTEEETFLFGYEESYGYLVGNHARDKDAVVMAVYAAEMAAYYKKQGRDLASVLESIYEQYGYYEDGLENINFEGKAGMEKMKMILEDLRLNPLKELAGEIVETIDYLNDDTGLPRENVIKYILGDGSFVALRPSGTEPKFKLYFCVVDLKNKANAKEKIQRLKKDILAKIKL